MHRWTSASNCSGDSTAQVAFQLTAVIDPLTLNTVSLTSDYTPQSAIESVLCVKVSWRKYDTKLTLPFQVLSILVRYIVESNDESMAVLGVSLLQELMQAAVTHLDAEGWERAVDAFETGCSFSSLETLLADR